MKKIIFFIIFLCFCLTISINIKANNDIYVMPGGESIGLKIETGVEIVGKYTVSTSDGKKNPWQKSNIEIGDYIEKVNDYNIENNESLLKILKQLDESSCVLTIKRNNKLIKTNIDIVKTVAKEPSIGLYVKDKILGIGTLSFVYDNKFASLGHGIYENNELININNGDLTYSNVVSIKKATLNQSGEKRATLASTKIGEIKTIKDSGVYGVISQKINKNKVKIADIEDVKCDDAVIYTVINGNKVETFDIEIIETKYQNSINSKGIKIKVTDSVLLNETGGIIQGMSGSPIIQNGELVGVVSHVTLDNPMIGYAVYAKWMYEDLINY